MQGGMAHAKGDIVWCQAPGWGFWPGTIVAEEKALRSSNPLTFEGVVSFQDKTEFQGPLPKMLPFGAGLRAGCGAGTSARGPSPELCA
ncbi:unnamed protein product, partial [Phaeothamnion confervicola]